MKRFIPYVLALLMMPTLLSAQDTADDKGYLTNLLESNLSGAGRVVTIDGFSGALSSTAAIEKMTIADDKGVWLTLEKVTLDWNRSALLSKRLEVNELSAETILLPRLPAPDSSAPTPEAKPFALPELPVSVRIDKISAKRVVLGQALFGEAAEVSLNGQVSLIKGKADAKLEITRIDGKTGAFALELGFTGETEQLALSLSVQEDKDGIAANLIGLPGRPAVDLKIVGDAPLSDFQAQIALATDGQDRLNGTVTLSAEADGDNAKPRRLFRAELGGDISQLFAPDYRPFFGPDIRLVAVGNRGADGALTIDQLSVKARALDLSGSLAMSASGWPERLSLQGRIADGNGGPVQLPLTGTVTKVLSTDLTIEYDVTKGNGWEASAVIAGLDQRDFAADRLSILGGGTLQPGDGLSVGQLTANLAFEGQNLRPSDPAIAQALGESTSGTLSLRYVEGQPLEISLLQMEGADYGFNGSASVQNLSKGVPVTGKGALHARDLSRFALIAGQPLSGEADLEISGRYEIFGGIFDLAVDGKARDLAIVNPRIDRLLAGESTVSAAARRTVTGLFIDAANVETKGVTASANGELRTGASRLRLNAILREPDLPEPVMLDAEAVQTGAIWAVTSTANGPGNTEANISVRIATDQTPQQASGSIGLRSNNLGAYERLIGRPVTGGVDIVISGNGALNAETFDVKVDGTGRNLGIGIPRVDGLLAGGSVISAHVRRAAAGLMVETALLETKGITAVAKGELQANASRLNVTATLREPDLAEPVVLHADAVQSGTDWDVTAKISGPGNTLATASTRIETDSTPQQASGTVALSADDLGAYARLVGRSISGGISITASGNAALTGETFDLVVAGTGQSTRVGIPTLDVLLRGPSKFDLSAKRETGAITLRNVDIVSNEITANASGTLGDDGSSIKYSVRLRDVGVLAPDFGGPATADGRIEQSGSGYRISTDATGPGGIQGTLSGTAATNFSTVDLALRGTAPLGLANELIQPRSLNGTASFDLAVRGRPELSSVSGTIRTANARLSAPTLRTALTDFNAEITLANGSARIDAKSTVAEGGALSASGQVSLQAPYTANLTATLRDVVFSDPSLYKTSIGGQLTVIGPMAGGARISGQFALGQTDVLIPSTGFAGIGPIPNITHKNEPAASKATRAKAGIAQGSVTESAKVSGPSYPLDVIVDAPSRIFVRGRGLDAELGGRLRLSGTTKDIIPQGKFELLRGRLDILGKRLNLTEGSATLQGDFTPYIRLVAQTQSGDVLVSVVVEGPASRPEITFVSQPELPEDEVLASLLFGRDISTISPLQAIQLAGAVATLAGRGGDGIVSRLRSNFGLDDLDVTTGNDGTTAVRAGKYLSENIYTDVVVGSDGKTEINLNLDLTPSITAKGRLGSEGDTGLGIYFERDY